MSFVSVSCIQYPINLIRLEFTIVIYIRVQTINMFNTEHVEGQGSANMHILYVCGVHKLFSKHTSMLDPMHDSSKPTSIVRSRKSLTSTFFLEQQAVHYFHCWITTTYNLCIYENAFLGCAQLDKIQSVQCSFENFTYCNSSMQLMKILITRVGGKFELEDPSKENYFQSEGGDLKRNITIKQRAVSEF